MIKLGSDRVGPVGNMLVYPHVKKIFFLYFLINTMNELYQFSKQDLILVSQIKKRQNISAIFYHFWINLVNPEEKFVFVDTIEIVFDTTTTYFFKINDEDSGYTISTTYDFEEEQKALRKGKEVSNKIFKKGRSEKLKFKVNNHKPEELI